MLRKSPKYPRSNTLTSLSVSTSSSTRRSRGACAVEKRGPQLVLRVERVTHARVGSRHHVLAPLARAIFSRESAHVCSERAAALARASHAHEHMFSVGPGLGLQARQRLRGRLRQENAVSRSVLADVAGNRPAVPGSVPGRPTTFSRRWSSGA